MEQVYIINKATFAGYEDVSVNIEAPRLNVFIKKAQDLDLKPFLGGAFYYDLIKSLVFDSNGVLVTDQELPEHTPQKYVDLILGTEYTVNDTAYYFDGLIPALIYWSFARFIEADAVRYTATGPVIKHHESADVLKPSDTAKLVAQQRSVANANANWMADFLNANKSVYPLWRYNPTNANSRQPGPRLRAVDATKANLQRRQYGYGFGLNNIL